MNVIIAQKKVHAQYYIFHSSEMYGKYGHLHVCEFFAEASTRQLPQIRIAALVSKATFHLERYIEKRYFSVTLLNFV